MPINVDLGTVKLGSTVTHTVDISRVEGVTEAKMGCRPCTKIVSFGNGKLIFTFTPDQTGAANKHISLKNADGHTIDTVYFKANVV